MRSIQDIRLEPVGKTTNNVGEGISTLSILSKDTFFTALGAKLLKESMG
jgi:hypothetical protein